MNKLFLILILSIISICTFSQTKYCEKIDNEQIIQKEYITISYNLNRKIPNYVGYYLTKKNLTGNESRETRFYDEPLISSFFQSHTYNYTNSGYDRGHMSPAADWKFSRSAMHDSFSMANICPQKPQLNRIYWKSIEDEERDCIKLCDTLFVITGSICNTDVKIKNNIYVPTYFYKTIIGIYNDQIIITKAWLFKNTNDIQKPDTCKTTIENIENMIHKDLYYDFWFNKK